MDSRGPQGRVESKRSLTDVIGAPSDNGDDEVEEFFALVEKIHAANKILKEKRMACCYKDERFLGQEDSLKVEKLRSGPSPWKLSFEWEDFHETNMNSYCSSSMDDKKQGVQSAQHGNPRLSDKEDLDLNKEPTSE